MPFFEAIIGDSFLSSCCQLRLKPSSQEYEILLHSQIKAYIYISKYRYFYAFSHLNGSK